MQSFGQGLCARVCLTWFVLSVWVVSCAAPPPALKQPSPLPVGASIWLAPHQPVSGPVVGKPVRPAPRPIQASNQGFRIQGEDSTTAEQCFYLNKENQVGSKVTAEISMNYGSLVYNRDLIEGRFYRQIDGNQTDSGELTLNSFNIREISGAVYATSLYFPNLSFPTELFKPDQSYSASFPSDTQFTFNDSHQFLNGSTGTVKIQISSTQATISVEGTIYKSRNHPTDPFYYGEAKISGSLDYPGSIQTCVPKITLKSNIDTQSLHVMRRSSLRSVA